MRVLLLLLSLTCLVSSLIPAKDAKPNVFVLTDISNEPDDAESLVRLLLYSNELNISGIVATTSYWLNYTIHDEDIYPILDAYEKVHPNLLKHSPYYPSAEYFRSIVSVGNKEYGLKALENSVSAGAKNLIAAVDGIPEGEAIYVLAWGGASVIAEALNEVKQTRATKEVETFISKVVVYAISDQDNAGPWIRFNFPFLRYIVSIHGFNQYGQSTWVGMSGEIYNNFDNGGPDYSLVSKKWVERNVRSVGPLGAAYPEFMFIMEGDTPSTLYVLPNGLNVPTHPEYGGWGGRYTCSDLSGITHNHFGDAQDHVRGVDGKIHVSNQATIWRWRDAYQSDFATRMQWTIKSFEETAHQPIVIVNDTETVQPYHLNATTGSEIIIDLSNSYDLNDRPLSFNWFHYREVTLTQGNMIEIPAIEIIPIDPELKGSIVKFTVPSFEVACYNLFNRPDFCKVYHLIAEVKNDANVTGYLRVVLQTIPGVNDKYVNEIIYEQSFGKMHDEL